MEFKNQSLVPIVINKMIDYFGNDCKRINHALKVYGYAKAISALEILSEEEQFILDISAILHDIGIKEAELKYGSSIGRYQEIEGPLVAQTILGDFNFAENILDRIRFIIGHHHSYNRIDGNDFQILVEADFLVNIDEEHMNAKQIESIYEKYFKTNTGKSILKKTSCF